MASFGPGYGRAESAGLRAGRAGHRARSSTRFFVVGDDLAGRMRANGVAAGAHRGRALEPRAGARSPRPTTPADRAAAEARAARRSTPTPRWWPSWAASTSARTCCCCPTPWAGRRPGPATLLVAGAGPLADQLQRRGRGPHRRRRRAPAGPRRTTWPSVMRAADVLALPSSAEGLPQVLVQAARVAGCRSWPSTSTAWPSCWRLGRGRPRRCRWATADAFVAALRAELAAGRARGARRPDDAVWAQWDAGRRRRAVPPCATRPISGSISAAAELSGRVSAGRGPGRGRPARARGARPAAGPGRCAGRPRGTSRATTGPARWMRRCG